MMADITQYLPTGILGTAMLAVGYGGRLLLEWVRTLKSGALEEKKAEMAEGAQHVTDAAAANAIILETLQAVRHENQRLSDKNVTLEERNVAKDLKIELLQQEVRELRAQVYTLLQRIDGVDLELGDLRDNGD
jgi:chromosome segregation ATPase